MENSYGIGVRNRYELFYNEDIDPMDLLKQTEKIKDKASEKENKGKTAKAKSPVVKKGVKTETAPKISDKTSLPVSSMEDTVVQTQTLSAKEVMVLWNRMEASTVPCGTELFIVAASDFVYLYSLYSICAI
nr:uncharacterized protein LOC128698736 isoform X2 [Cherax quadricarinatus]